MAKADKAAQLPPGLKCASYAFDLTTALQTIRDKLPKEYRNYERWNYMLEHVFSRSIVNLKMDYVKIKEYSNLFIQVYFLETLWKHLFGVLAGDSPWHGLLQDIDAPATNGKNDQLLAIDGLVRLSQQKVARDAERTIAWGLKSKAFGDAAPPNIMIDAEELVFVEY